MKILFIGSTAGNARSRAEGARRAGWEIRLAPDPWQGPRYGTQVRAEFWLRNGPLVRCWNWLLVEEISAFKPDVTWVEEPKFLYASTVRFAKTIGATVACAYVDDPRNRAHYSRHFDRSLNEYDILFATKDDLLRKWQQKGAHNVAKFWKGYSPSCTVLLRLREILL